jgi:hypothetical protein
LELLAPETVTRVDIADAIAASDDSSPVDDARVEVVIDRLRRAGWLLSLRTRGVWEFAPARRSGAFGSGDPFTELRAALATRAALTAAVAMESAAFLRGLAEHPPHPDVVAVAKGTRRIGALRAYRLVYLGLPESAMVDLDGLPVHTATALVAGMAIVPRAYGDWPNVPTWLAQAAGRICAADPVPDDGGFMGERGLVALLASAPVAAWSRAAYLLRVGGQPEASAAVLSAAPAMASGPVYLGPRDRRGHYDHVTGVYDSLMDVA